MARSPDPTRRPALGPPSALTLDKDRRASTTPLARAARNVIFPPHRTSIAERSHAPRGNRTHRHRNRDRHGSSGRRRYATVTCARRGPSARPRLRLSETVHRRRRGGNSAPHSAPGFHRRRDRDTTRERRTRFLPRRAHRSVRETLHGPQVPFDAGGMLDGAPRRLRAKPAARRRHLRSVQGRR